MASADDQRWMRRAIRQGLRGLGVSSPNPSVGSVIVRDGKVIGEGFHRQCGGPHAEREALADCQRRGHDPQGATVYVTLAPCTKHGRTPPCSDALIAAQVARVVVAQPDPMQGDTAGLLRAAGIAYEDGVCPQESLALHGGFLSRITQGRPRLTAKWAMTVDGHLACENGASGWISHAAALNTAARAVSIMTPSSLALILLAWIGRVCWRRMARICVGLLSQVRPA